MDSPIKWHGGKHYLASKFWEIAKSTPHIHRVEVYGGSCAFTLASDPEGYSEVVNDIDGELMNFWNVLRCEEAFQILKRLLEATPCSEPLWDAITHYMDGGNCVERAWKFFVRCRQSMAGRMKNFTPLAKTRTRRGMNELPSAWLSAIAGLPEVHARLQRVAILCKPAIEMIRKEDGPGTLFYLDPPYLPETRTSKKVYQHEMSYDDHFELLEELSFIKGKFMLSGYPSTMYNAYAKSHRWNQHSFDLPNNSAGGDIKQRKTEVLWTNF
jgi:DNA adenine methylase